MRRPKYIHLHAGAVTSVDTGSDVPARFFPARIHPNPFNLTTSIRFSSIAGAQDRSWDGDGRRATLKSLHLVAVKWPNSRAGRSRLARTR
jgi:hypothetical protein